MAGAVRAVSTGAIWTRQMKHDADYAASPDCRRCQSGEPETLKHWAYTCAGNQALPDIGAHDEVLMQVDAQWDGAELLFGRGLTPRNLLPEMAVTEDSIAVGTGTEYGHCQPTTADRGWAVIFGDASMHAKLPSQLRRVGCAIIQCPWMEHRVVATRVRFSPALVRRWVGESSGRC